MEATRGGSRPQRASGSMVAPSPDVVRRSSRRTRNPLVERRAVVSNRAARARHVRRRSAPSTRPSAQARSSSHAPRPRRSVDKWRGASCRRDVRLAGLRSLLAALHEEVGKSDDGRQADDDDHCPSTDQTRLTEYQPRFRSAEGSNSLTYCDGRHVRVLTPSRRRPDRPREPARAAAADARPAGRGSRGGRCRRRRRTRPPANRNCSSAVISDGSKTGATGAPASVSRFSASSRVSAAHAAVIAA